MFLYIDAHLYLFKFPKGGIYTTWVKVSQQLNIFFSNCPPKILYQVTFLDADKNASFYVNFPTIIF